MEVEPSWAFHDRKLICSQSVAEFFALMAILSRNNFQQTLWSIDILTDHWSLMEEALQTTYRNNWLANNHQITDCTHPIVGDWVLEYAILHDNPIADEFLTGTHSIHEIV